MRRFFVSLSILLSLAPLAYSAATPDQKNIVMSVNVCGPWRITIEKLVELNEGQRYAYDRDALVKMLDEALARTRPRGQ
jgi:hypothetical protein